MSQQQLAQRMRRLGHEWHQQTTSNVEAGTRSVDTDELVALALALGVTLSFLLEPDPAWFSQSVDEREYVGDAPGGFWLGDADDTETGTFLPMAYAKMLARSEVPITYDGEAVSLPKATPYLRVYERYGISLDQDQP